MGRMGRVRGRVCVTIHFSMSHCIDNLRVVLIHLSQYSSLNTPIICLSPQGLLVSNLLSVSLYPLTDRIYKY